MNKILICSVAATALALAGCSGSGTGEETDQEAMAGSATEGAMASDAAADVDASADAATPTDAKGFVDMASASDMFEIESGKLAQQIGTSQAVKDFGAMMVADHTKSSADLKTAAASANGVTVAPKLSAKQQSDLDALKNAKGNFHTLYKQQQTAAHTQALALLRGYGSGGDNEALKAFATKTAPVVEKHLAEVRGLD